jgi:hypothetical protein
VRVRILRPRPEGAFDLWCVAAAGPLTFEEFSAQSCLVSKVPPAHFLEMQA